MSSSGELRRSLDRYKPSSASTFQRRPRNQLVFLNGLEVVPAILLDTTVYVDKLQGRLKPGMDAILDSARIWHSSVTEAEMGVLVGLLDPANPGTAQAIEAVTGSIENRPASRIVTPDRETWREAGVVAGHLARLQQYGKADRRRVLNDALIFLSATKAGLAVLTRNLADYDLLMQLIPQGSAIFYEV